MSGGSASAAPQPDGLRTEIVARSRIALRAPLLALGFVALVSGLYGGLSRLGWALPHRSALAALHGPLLLSGLFGTLISLERAVALGRTWPYAAPSLAAAGTIALLAGAPDYVGAGAYILASAALVCASLVIVIQQPAVFTGALMLGAVTWLAGNALWFLGHPISDVTGWWLSFLILTIAGERLELSRLAGPKRGSEAMFLFAAGLLMTGAQNGLVTRNGGILFGLGLLLTTVWLLRHDIARRNIRHRGQIRFFAACMMAGYAWLGFAGVAVMAFPPGDALYGYDLALHSILIGFVLSMVFGHALIILPAVTRLRVTYRPAMYGPLIVLHTSLVIRALGDIFEWQAVRQWSGPASILALVGFAAIVGIGARGFQSVARATEAHPK